MLLADLPRFKNPLLLNFKINFFWSTLEHSQGVQWGQLHSTNSESWTNKLIYLLMCYPKKYVSANQRNNLGNLSCFNF